MKMMLKDPKIANIFSKNLMTTLFLGLYFDFYLFIGFHVKCLKRGSSSKKAVGNYAEITKRNRDEIRDDNDDDFYK